jgi:hypothetical protein
MWQKIYSKLTGKKVITSQNAKKLLEGKAKEK